ncbi:hypothetical protein EV121DRAFT_271319 [Schizophyllum commune]
MVGLIFARFYGFYPRPVTDCWGLESGYNPATVKTRFSPSSPVPPPITLGDVDFEYGILPNAAHQTIYEVNRTLGLALVPDEMDYFVSAYTAHVGHDPTDAELFMFAQMICNTEKVIEERHTISVYSDNAVVLEGQAAVHYFRVQSHDAAREPVCTVDAEPEDAPMLIKVETHNHQTAVKIRDEGATGRGSEPKASLAGFTVSNLRIPGFMQPWEAHSIGKPAHIASALDIGLEAPLSASAFNNEFGRPALAGYFRTFQHSLKVNIQPGARLVVLGGPGMLIGLGGGAASSQAGGAGSADLDFASVQRDNAEMQRHCQQVIAACVAAGQENPIASIHDVGAGGLSNTLPALVHDAGLGPVFETRDVPVADSSLSPMEIWCNESQERRNKVDVGAMDGVIGHAMEGIDKGAENLITREEAKEAADVNWLVPRYDTATNDPKDVYPLHSVIPGSEWKVLLMSAFEQAPGFKGRRLLLPARRSEWLQYHLRRVFEGYELLSKVSNQSRRSSEVSLRTLSVMAESPVEEQVSVSRQMPRPFALALILNSS